MFRKFARDRRGNYAMITALAMLPVMGAVTLAVDYSEVSRQRQAAQNALDATNLAIALSYLDGDSDSEVRSFAQEYFEANFRPSDTADPRVSVTFPTGSSGGGTLKTCADLKYPPYFWPAVKMMLGDNSDSTIDYTVCTEVRLKNTMEVALVLDNSGSMGEWGFGSGKKRIDLLKDASVQLVETLANQAGLMQQVAKPVQFGLVPFAASINVGPEHRNADWMDTEGRSTVHHNNFDWDTMPDGLSVEKKGGVYRKTGENWGAERDDIVTRFTLYDTLSGQVCERENWWGHCREWSEEEEPATSWAGCVEVRPYPYGVNDAIPTINEPATLFVPMFAPDEADPKKNGQPRSDNSWWDDALDDSEQDAEFRQEYMPKYFESSEGDFMGMDEGPNRSCSTQPITPLTDVTTSYGLEEIKDAINDMYPGGNTNVPEGIGWGWRVVSSNEPFTEGRDDEQKGNDKVVIVLTDGANTYSKPRWDAAHNKSTYAAYGYAKTHRIYEGTRLSGYSRNNYQRAMNRHMLQTCENAKDDNIIVMTVALDLTDSKREEREQIESLEECASVSRFRTDENGDPVKLFWNTRGDKLSETFKEIADELSNLRLVS